MRWKKPKRSNPHQLQIEWLAANAIAVQTVQLVTAPGRAEHGYTSPAVQEASPRIAKPLARSFSDEAPRHPHLVQVLPWDFVRSFPKPLEDAIEAGVLSPDDVEPASVRAMHGEHIRHLLAVLVKQDRLADARRRGVDPATQVKPASKAAAETLKAYFISQPAELERHWHAVLGAYEAAFGEDAAAALVKAVKARHAGVEVTAVAAPAAGAAAVNVPVIGETSDRAMPIPATPKSFKERAIRPVSTKIIARLPAPRALRHAVAAWHFGEDEDGPVNPSADEVREITENHAAEMIELIADLKEARRRRLDEASCKERSQSIDAAVAKYAEDFGDRAANQLLAYARRQALLDAASPAQGRSR